MWWLDFPSLVLIIVAGIQLGIQGFFGFDATGYFLGPDEKYFFMLVGLGALWQGFRQKFF